MAVVVKSIGATGRDHSTIAAWNSSLTNVNYPEQSIAIGELYNDGVFDESDLDISCESNIKAVVLTVASGEGHGGDPSTGVVVRPSSSFTGPILRFVSNVPYLIDGIRFDANGNMTGNFSPIVGQTSGVGSVHPTQNRWNRCIVTGGSSTNSSRALAGIGAGVRPMMVTNCLIYDVVSNGTASSTSGYGIGGDDYIFAINNTIDNIDWQNGTGTNYGIGSSMTSNSIVQNNIITRISGTGSECIQNNSLASDGNATDDTTGETASITIADEYEDHTADDYRIKSGADAAGAAVRLSGELYCVDEDLTGVARAVAAWDCGCLNTQGGYVSAGGNTIIIPGDRRR